mgnify:CR=1 FL=1
MAEQEYTPTETRLRDRVKGSLGEYAHEFGIDGEAAMDAWIDQALAERDNRVRADERAKRPDREQIAEAIQGDGSAYLRLHHPESWAVKLAQADRVLSSLALEPETRETEVVEFNDGPAFRSKGMVHTLTVAPTSGGWLVTCQDFHGESSCNLPSGDAIKLAQMLHPEPAAEVTDERAEAAARRLFVYDTATAGDSEGAWDAMDEETILRKMYLTRARAALEAAREVSRG